MLKEIADTLIARTYEGRRDVILFIIVDLINRVSPRNTPIAEDRVRYAKLNLLAGDKAIRTPDFSSAFEFIESGISFLNDDHWEHEYDLSLALFKNAAGVTCSLGKSHLMTTRLNEVSIFYEVEFYLVSLNETSNAKRHYCRFLIMHGAMKTNLTL